MVEKYAVCRTDKLYATDNRAGMRSFVYFDANDEKAAIENGNIVVLTGLLEDGDARHRELYKAVAPTGEEEKASDLVLVCSPELMYDERYHALSDFVNEAGDYVRGYQLHEKDVFSVTALALDLSDYEDVSEISIGDAVAVAAGETKLSVSADADSGVIGHVIDINVVGPYTYYAIQLA